MFIFSLGINEAALLALDYEDIDFQREHYKVAIRGAKRIIVVGVNCNYKVDRHIWEPLEQTTAEIIFVEPYEKSILTIKEWNNNVKIIPKNFKNGFNNICNLIINK